VATVPVETLPHGLAINSSGTRVYVVNFNGSVSVIDTGSNSVMATVPVGGGYSLGQFVGTVACADTNGSTQQGIDLVKANPGSYQLFTQTQIDAAKQEGINLVKANPSDYQLLTQTQSDAAVKTEQLKWDANGDGRIGLEDIIRMLQVIAGLRP